MRTPTTFTIIAVLSIGAAFAQKKLALKDLPPEAQKAIGLLKAEQVAGNFKIAQFYERGHKWAGAVVYYNEVLQLDPNSTYAESARQKIEQLKPRLPRAID